MACFTTPVVGLMERLGRVFSRVPFAVPPVIHIYLAVSIIPRYYIAILRLNSSEKAC